MDHNQFLELFKENKSDALKIAASSIVLNKGQERVNKLIENLREESKNEKGWCKFRDQFFLPILLQGTMYVINNKLDDKIKKISNKKK